VVVDRVRGGPGHHGLVAGTRGPRAHSRPARLIRTVGPEPEPGHGTAREVWKFQGALDGSHILTGCGACMRLLSPDFARLPKVLEAVGNRLG